MVELKATWPHNILYFALFSHGLKKEQSAIRNSTDIIYISLRAEYAILFFAYIKISWLKSLKLNIKFYSEIVWTMIEIVYSIDFKWHLWPKVIIHFRRWLAISTHKTIFKAGYIAILPERLCFIICHNSLLIRLDSFSQFSSRISVRNCSLLFFVMPTSCFEQNHWWLLSDRIDVRHGGFCLNFPQIPSRFGAVAFDEVKCVQQEK